MDQTVVDFTLGLNAQAWAVLHMLAGYEGDFMHRPNVTTHAYYGHREHGFVINVERRILGLPAGRTLHLLVAEHGPSDQIIVRRWVDALGPWHHATVQERAQAPETSETRRYFRCGAAGEAADYMWAEIERHVARTEADDEREDRVEARKRGPSRAKKGRARRPAAQAR